MNFIDIYNKMENPIDKKGVVEKLLDIFVMSIDKESFYNKLIEKNEKMDENKKSVDDFYAYMFNEWKNNVIGVPFKRFVNLAQTEKFKKDFSQMRDYLEKLSDAKTVSDIQKYLNPSKGKELKETLNNYYWIYNPESDWEFVHSSLVTVRKYSDPMPEHHFILNIPNNSIYIMAKKIVEKCNIYELPYYFRFDKTGKRIDSLVFTFDTDNMINYMRIFNEIKKEDPNLIKGFRETPILTGSLTNWLGYASGSVEYDEKFDFYDIRSSCIFEAIKESILNWIRANNNESVSQEILSKIISSIKDNVEKADKNKLKKLNENELKEVFGEIINDIIDDFCSNSSKDIDITNLENDESISISDKQLDLYISSAIINLAKNDVEYINNLKECIYKYSEKYGIDKKFCFNTNILEIMKKNT